MVVLRRTEKLSRQLPSSEGVPGESDTALGDWYVNRLVVDRQPLLLVVSAKSLLALLVPGRGVRTLPARLPGLVQRRLLRLGVPERIVHQEVGAMSPVRVATTVDRSVVGTLVDFAFAVPLYLERGAWDESTLPFIEGRLAETPCRSSRSGNQTIFPDQTAPRLLEARWDAT